MLEDFQIHFKSVQWCLRHQKLSVKHEWLLFPAKIGFLKWDCYTTIYITSEVDFCRIYDPCCRFLIERKLCKIQQHFCTYIEFCFPNGITSLSYLCVIKFHLLWRSHLELLKSHYIHSQELQLQIVSFEYHQRWVFMQFTSFLWSQKHLEHLKESKNHI